MENGNPARSPASRAPLARRAHRGTTALVVTALGVTLAPAAAEAMPAVGPQRADAPTAAAAASARRLPARKRINRKVKATGRLVLLPGTTIGTSSLTPDGVGHLRGATIAGRFEGRLLGGRRARKGLPRNIAKLLDLNLRGKLNADRYFKAPLSPLVAKGLLGGRSRSAPKVTGCIRFSAKPAGAGQPPTQGFKLIGGTRAAAGWSVTGKLPALSFDQPVPSSITLRVKTAKKRKLDKRCAALVRKLAA